MASQVQTQAQAQQQAPVEGYFDLHTVGVGYLNGIRWVHPHSNRGRQAKPFLACRIAALRGAKGAPATTLFDLTVSSQECVEVLDSLFPVVNDSTVRHTVIISFRIGDIYAHSYYGDIRDQNGNKTGQTEPRALIKGRLILINSIKVDGEHYYSRPRKEDGDDQGQEQASESGDPQPASAAAVNQPGASRPRSQSQPARRPVAPPQAQQAPAVPVSQQQQAYEDEQAFLEDEGI